METGDQRGLLFVKIYKIMLKLQLDGVYANAMKFYIYLRQLRDIILNPQGNSMSFLDLLYDYMRG